MMTRFKQLALNAYYVATSGARRRAMNKRVAAGEEPIRILFYHRVADTHMNAWTLGTRAFARQIRWLKRRYEIVDLQEAQRRIAAGRNTSPAAVITFDDGYAENCDFATPFLLREKIPFTYFVASAFVHDNIPFPHDVAAERPLPPNTPEQIRALADAGVEIGAHTRTHADLGKIDKLKDLTDEIVGSKRDLESMIERPVNFFAFPYGMHDNLSADAFRIAYLAGFAGVCSAYGGYNAPGGEPFHLQRFHGDPEWIRFKNWMTVDPRKLRIVRPFELGDFRSSEAISDRNRDCGIDRTADIRNNAAMACN